MDDKIKEMSKNIGSLVSFLRKRPDWIDHIDKNIPKIDISISEKVYYYLNNIKDPILCDCGDRRAFIGFKGGHRSTCGNKKCFTKKRKETCVEKWGVDNPKKSKEILLKEQKNILSKWGKHYMNNKKVRSKFNKTMNKKWGVDWAQQSVDIKNKSSDTWNKNPNKDWISKKKSDKILNKSKGEKESIEIRRSNTIINKWGSIEDFYIHVSNLTRERSLENYQIDHHLSHPDIIKKRVNTFMQSKIDKIKDSLPPHISFISKSSNIGQTDSYIRLLCSSCKKDFVITRQYFQLRLRIGDDVCLNCNPTLSGTSHMENDLFNFISSIYNGSILRGYKGITSELDIYLPELKIAFEFNGLFWHSSYFKDRKYHLNKTLDCEKNGVSLIHIWEDDWIYKNEIVKSIITNKLGKSKKIGARKCSISEVGNKECREFLESNHIQGFLGSKIKIGLYYGGELVSLMTFGGLRKPLGQSSKNNEYELLRFCNKINYTIVGGASKLFKYFIKNYSPNKVISYSDSSRGKGDLYKNLEFSFVSNSTPNYYYIINGIRKHRFNFRKDILIKSGEDPNLSEPKIMENRGIHRIFDCGSKKWEWSYQLITF